MREYSQPTSTNATKMIRESPRRANRDVFLLGRLAQNLPYVIKASIHSFPLAGTSAETEVLSRRSCLSAEACFW